MGGQFGEICREERSAIDRKAISAVRPSLPALPCLQICRRDERRPILGSRASKALNYRRRSASRSDSIFERLTS